MLRQLGQRFAAVMKVIGYAQAWLLLTVFYVLILGPVALIVRWLTDPLRLRTSARPPWQAKTLPADPWTWAKSQS